MKKFLDVLNKIEDAILASFLAVMVLVIFAETVFRFTGIYTITWSEELARYLMIGIVFLGISRGSRNDSHYGVDNFRKMLPKKMHRPVFLIRTIIVLWFITIIFVQSIYFISGVMRMGQVSPALQIPMWIPYSLIPIGFFAMGLRTIQYIVLNWQSLDASREDVVEEIEGIEE